MIEDISGKVKKKIGNLMYWVLIFLDKLGKIYSG